MGGEKRGYHRVKPSRDGNGQYFIGGVAKGNASGSGDVSRVTARFRERDNDRVTEL